jgi:hypothetical protein
MYYEFYASHIRNHVSVLHSLRRATNLTLEASLSGSLNNFMILRNTNLHCFGKYANEVLLM